MSGITVRQVIARFGFEFEDGKLKTYNQQVEETKKKLEGTEKAAEAAGKATGKAGEEGKKRLKEAGKEADNLGERISKGIGALKSAIAFEALKKGVEMLSEASTRTANFDSALESAGFGITAAAQATEGFVNNFDLATGAAAANRAGIAQTDATYAAFAGQVTKLAHAAQMEAGPAIAALAKELETGSTGMLEQLGVTVDTDAATQAYASSIGKLVENLTDAEKATAIQGAAMAALADEAAGLTSGLSANNAALERAKVKAGNMADGLARGATEAAGATVRLAEYANSILKMGGGWDYAIDKGKEEAELLAKLEEATGKVADQQSMLGKQLIDSTVSLTAWAAEVLVGADNLGLAGDALDDYIDKQARLKVVQDAAAEQESRQHRGLEKAEKDLEAFKQEQANASVVYGPEAPEKKTAGRRGSRRPGEAYEFTSLALIDSATESDAITEELLGPGFRLKKKKDEKTLEQLYGSVRAGGVHSEVDRAELGQRLFDKMKGEAGGGGPTMSDAQGLGTRIFNIDNRREVNIEVIAPEGVAGLSREDARRVARDFGGDIADAIDDWFSSQTDALKRVIEG